MGGDRGAAIPETLSRYRVLSRLGAGGMGEVYLAEDVRLRRRVALKVLPAAWAADPERLERFEREAEAVAALNHPNIVTIYSVEDEGDLRFLTMELVEGGTLTERIPPGGMPLRELLDIAVPLADALRAAHERGIVHRDMKPGNVMLTSEGRVKVLDFGLAKLRTAEAEGSGPLSALATEERPLTVAGAVLGTIQYMAPEQLLGRPADQRCDIFALGVMLYEMASGTRPFRGDSHAEAISAILRDEAPLLIEKRPDLPEELGRLIARCLEKDPERRLQTAKDLRNELERLSRDLDTGALRPPASPVVRRRASARRAALAIGGALALAAGAFLAARAFRQPVAPEAARTSAASPGIAVLPLANLSGDPEYFVDGMTDALISALAGIESLRVISRQSVMGYKVSKKPLAQIARDLGVDLLVEGSVVRAGDRVRVTAQLLRADPEKSLWSRSYERDFRDVLSLQGELARAIAREIRVELKPEEAVRLEGAPVEPAVIEAHLKGRFHWNRRNAEGFAKAIEHFQEALSLDAAHAPSWAGLADTYVLLGYTSLSPAEPFAKAKAAALRALELDETLAEAHASLGMVEFAHEWNWERAERELRRAIELKPSYATAHQWYWAYLEAMGRKPEALEAIERASRLDPLSLINSLDVAVHHSFSRDHDRAIAQCVKTLEMEPRFAPAHVWLWVAYDHKGMPREAVSHFVTSMRLSGYGEAAAAVEAEAARSGYRAAMRRAAEELTELSKTRYVESNQIAWLWVAAGEKERALDWLEQAFKRRAAVLVWLNVGGEWDSLREEPRFRELLARLRFPPRAG